MYTSKEKAHIGSKP